MSKKHFIALADDLRREKQGYIERHGQAAFDELVTFCCRFCRGENGQFNEGRFRDYVNDVCGPNGSKRKS